jgi:fibrillarin-like pre-rRNA processing protein
VRQVFPGVFEKKEGKKSVLLTRNATPGRTAFTEDVVVESGTEYRVWRVQHSKLAAAVIKDLKDFPFARESKVLYLGASHGYTVSHLSDIMEAGSIFAVEIAPRVARDLVFLAETRRNILPIIADAAHPEMYYHAVPAVDVLYQDVAQRNQAEIFLKNAELFLKKGGCGFFAVKARSINVVQPPHRVFGTVEAQLRQKMQLLAKINLSPFQRDHMLFVVRK